ncbi:hypothetical protein H5410_052519 [Solanum commersonii]|uniref:Alpha/beta hydrolase fold-3 domain-containing protein n=1 Tax=Solanum commersonii TaxID=4109 RepID=A0A9J5X3M0_SOLCO|nr:hypothetical protein H5410_052519 [Solanum commersonii]
MLTCNSQDGGTLRTRIALSFVSTITDYSRRQNDTVNRRRLGIFGLKTSANPNPVNDVKSYDLTVDSSRDLWFRLFIPTTNESRNLSSLPIIVFFHGGEFVYLSPDTKAYDAVCRRFARKTPAVVVSVNYRLAPEHKYPAQYDDGFDMLKFLDNEKNRELLLENVDLSRCFLAGVVSAGTSLITWLSEHLK